MFDIIKLEYLVSLGTVPFCTKVKGGEIMTRRENYLFRIILLLIIIIIIMLIKIVPTV